MRVLSRTIGSADITAGTDQVVGWCPVPEGGKVLGVQGEIHIIGAEAQAVGVFQPWGYSAHLIPVDDAETALDIQTLWDQVVVKSLDPSSSAGTVTVDLDSDTADTTPEIEPGEMDINDLLGLTIEEKELIRPQLRWMSWAKSRQGGFIAGTPDTYNPTDFETFRSSRRLTADAPSMALIGISSPNADEEVTTITTPGTVGEWGILSNMELAMNQMLLGQIGLTEVGAETPYADIAGFIGELAAPDMLTPASTITAMTLSVLCVATWMVDLPDTSIPGTIDGR